MERRAVWRRGLLVTLSACCLLALTAQWLLSATAIGDASRGQTRPVARPVKHETRATVPLDLRSSRLALMRRTLIRQWEAQQARIRRWEAQQAWDRLHNNLWLHGVGAQLYTAWNAPITLKAINWYGFEFPPFVPGGLDHVPLDALLGHVKALGFNALRIEFADATVHWNPRVWKGVTANPQLRGLRALDIMGRILQRAHHFGLRVILCNSRSEPGMGPENVSGLWYTNAFPESVWQDDWLTLARRFAGDSAFVGADLRNEPHITGRTMDLQAPGGEAYDEQAYYQRGPLWGAYKGTYYHDRDWHYAAENMGNALLKINPNLLIVVEGVQLYLDPDRNRVFGGLWGSDLIGVQYDPIVLDRPSQLVYSAHEYGPHMYMARWFNKHTSYGSLSRRWWHHWGYLLTAPKSMRAPIFIGEVGTCNNFYACIASPRPWRQGFWWQSFVRYLREHPQVGWADWSLNPVGPFYPGQDNFYSLMTHDWKHVHPMLLRGLTPLLKAPALTGKGLP